MAVTFTLDLKALLAASSALAQTGSSGIIPDGSQYEPIELLHALRANAGKISVFNQVGEIALPPSRRVFAFLEQAVVPVRAPLGGIVHPKIWVLRYETADEPPPGRQKERRLRVLVSSRNLTFDPSWDTVVRLDESDDPKGASLGPVGELFEGLLGAAVGTVSVAHRDRVQSLSAAIKSSRFALPAGVEDLRAHVLGLITAPSPLPRTAERSLIVSPFVSDDFFTRVHPVPVDELVSRPEQLHHLTEATLERVKTWPFAFDDGSLTSLESEEVGASPHDPGRPLVGLHAKIFAFENEGETRLFVGSANATGAAFSSNVEVLLELIGRGRELGIDRLFDGTCDEPGLRRLFVTYHRREDADLEDGPTLVDITRRAIAQLQFDGVVEQSGSGWAVMYRSHEPVCAPVGTEIHCWPLASAGNRRRVVLDECLEARFETTIEAISGFLAFEVARRDDEDTRSGFVVPVSLVGVPESRERCLLRALVGNAERFFRYLLALLDEDPDQMDMIDALDSGSTDPVAFESGYTSMPVLEKLLRTMRREPAKLAGLHPLVTDLAADDALPPGFIELWMAIYDEVDLGASVQ
ncbi:MAG: hypothetical protein F4X64_00895 [Chloroflexi bacterium]|nr:hypothetical protein [Chloroflexota bacterium]